VAGGKGAIVLHGRVSNERLECYRYARGPFESKRAAALGCQRRDASAGMPAPGCQRRDLADGPLSADNESAMHGPTARHLMATFSRVNGKGM